LCPYCRRAEIVIKTSCQGVEVVCVGCGRLFPEEEVRQLLERRRFLRQKKCLTGVAQKISG